MKLIDKNKLVAKLVSMREWYEEQSKNEDLDAGMRELQKIRAEQMDTVLIVVMSQSEFDL